MARRYGLQLAEVLDIVTHNTLPDFVFGQAHPAVGTRRQMRESLLLQSPSFDIPRGGVTCSAYERRDSSPASLQPNQWP